MTVIAARLALGWRWLARRPFLVSQFLWPWLEEHSAERKQQLKDELARDVARIEALDFTKEPAKALEEARRFADSEGERRRGTDQKAATYLPLVAALIPLVLTLVSALWEKKAGSAPMWLNMVLLGLAVAYTARAGYWAFEELKVSVSHEPGLSDFEKAWTTSHPGQVLARRLLLHARQNREGVNKKVTYIIMAHLYLLRAFLTFSLLLLVNICWYLVGLIIQLGWPAPELMLTTPRQAIAAVAKVDALAVSLDREAAWTVLDRDCRRRTTGHAALTFAPDAASAITKIPPVLRPAADESGVVQTIRLVCANEEVARMRVWSIPTRMAALKPSPGLPDPLTGPATNTISSLWKFWPSAGTKDDPALLPASLLQQAVIRRDRNGRPLVLVITSIEPAVVRNL